MVAPAVESVIATLCSVVYAPVLTENAGVAACGVTGEVPLPLPPPPHPANSAATTNISGTLLERINSCHVRITENHLEGESRSSAAERYLPNCRPYAFILM